MAETRKATKKPVRLNMTGDEFKRLIEQRDPNHEVDTLQELMAMFEGIDDGETIAQYVHRVAVTPETMPEDSVGTEQIKNEAVMLQDLNPEVKDKMLNNLTDEDMEKWFDDDPTNDDPEEETPDSTQTETGE